MVVDAPRSPSSSEADPASCPGRNWRRCGHRVDRTLPHARGGGAPPDGRCAQGDHLRAGQGRAVDATVALGVNFDDVYDPERHHIISNASCTTNCLAPVAKVLHEEFGIRHGLMTTVHAYTADQNLQDGPHKDLRRARAGPSTWSRPRRAPRRLSAWSSRSSRAGCTGYALRVPIPTGSLVDLTVEAERPTTAEEVNAAFARAGRHRPARGDPRLQRGAACGDRHRRLALLGGLRRRRFTSVIDGTWSRSGLVRQRVGLFRPARGARRAGFRAGALAGLISLPPRALLLDLDGVLYVEDEPVPGARGARAPARAGLALRFVTNTTSRSRAAYAREAAATGLRGRDEELVTPAALALQHCRERGHRRWRC